MKRSLIFLALFALSFSLHAQTDTTKKSKGKTNSADSLMNAMGGDEKEEHVVSAFKATRLIISQTAETVKKNNLNFLVIHRFGDIAGDVGGGKTAFGLDAVNDVYIGFEYGLTDNLNVDLGRSTVGQLIELGLKYAVVHQTSDGSSPVAITLFGDYGVRAYQNFPSYGDRVSYLAQAIFSHKFGSDFSLLASPVFISNNTPMPNVPGSENNLFALTAAAKLKVTKHMGIVVDYAHPFSSFRTGANGFSDPLGFGIEVETGGHVFTLNVSNSRSASEITSLSASQADYGRGQYRLGFTISRMFDFNHKSSYK